MSLMILAMTPQTLVKSFHFYLTAQVWFINDTINNPSQLSALMPFLLMLSLMFFTCVCFYLKQIQICLTRNLSEVFTSLVRDNATLVGLLYISFTLGEFWLMNCVTHRCVFIICAHQMSRCCPPGWWMICTDSWKRPRLPSPSSWWARNSGHWTAGFTATFMTCKCLKHTNCRHRYQKFCLMQRWGLLDTWAWNVIMLPAAFWKV